MHDELVEVAVPEIWARGDLGKEHHHCVVIDARGKRLLSRRILKDETELLQLVADVLEARRTCSGPWSRAARPSRQP
ncbi:transposase [Streptomyces sp. NBC_00233]|uniref:IS110 family transposase n=1 Tax=Streptomyces sp. NBC_00233 TaxID=2975686 RepID=UPI00225234B0|nr:transposase [Streptomyces sp. NBC_00233]MCX5233035.1 IS110 family transposase [Streptomyces sp. NBC_00233]